MTFGQKLRRILRSKGMSQRELSRASTVGVDKIFRYIHEDVTPKAPDALKIARAIGHDLAHLLDDALSYPPEEGEGEGAARPAQHAVPLLSLNASCGLPAYPVDEVLGWYPVPPSLYREALYFVAAEGDSMYDPHRMDSIQHGDLLLVDRGLQPRDGDMAMVFLDGECTIRRVYIQPGRIRLVPSNPRYDAVVVDKASQKQVEFRGVVVGVQRFFGPFRWAGA